MEKQSLFIKDERSKGASKVFFSCHPSDFDKYFNELTDEVLAAQNCSIYYLKDQNYSPEDIQDYRVQLSQFNLFVFPITYKFLSEDNRAKDIDFNYAIDNKIPVLPILVEPGLYDMFNKFNTIQVLDKTTNDPTQDPYKVKLEKYVKLVLVDDETAKKIRNAFDAYIFLSYRKKDRKYAQEIMSLIHKNEFMRDIAIWYDEFLTPGEDFNNEISDNLLKSKLMALVVTPNINERYGDKGNYVIEQEYPNAIKENKPVLPIEAVETNKEELKNNFKDIQNPISKDNSEEITKFFKDFIIKNGLDTDDNDPEHLYFIGLAYLNGIDTDRDPDKAIKILEKSAKNNFIPAIKQLVQIYSDEFSGWTSYPKALKWQEILFNINKNDIFSNLNILNDYVNLLCSNGYSNKAKLLTKEYYKQCKNNIVDAKTVFDLLIIHRDICCQSGNLRECIVLDEELLNNKECLKDVNIFKKVFSQYLDDITNTNMFKVWLNESFTLSDNKISNIIDVLIETIKKGFNATDLIGKFIDILDDWDEAFDALNRFIDVQTQYVIDNEAVYSEDIFALRDLYRYLYDYDKAVKIDEMILDSFSENDIKLRSLDNIVEDLKDGEREEEIIKYLLIKKDLLNDGLNKNITVKIDNIVDISLYYIKFDSLNQKQIIYKEALPLIDSLNLKDKDNYNFLMGILKKYVEKDANILVELSFYVLERIKSQCGEASYNYLSALYSTGSNFDTGRAKDAFTRWCELRENAERNIYKTIDRYDYKQLLDLLRYLYPKKKDLYIKLYELAVKEFGEYSIQTVVALDLISKEYEVSSLNKECNQDIAIEYKEKSCDIKKIIYGEYSYKTLESLHQLAELYSRNGDMLKAKEIDDLFLKIIDNNNFISKQTIDIYEKLAFDFKNKPSSLSNIYEKIYMCSKELYGETSPKTIEALSRYADSFKFNNKDKYVSLKEKAIRQKYECDDDYGKARMNEELGKCFHNADMLDKAILAYNDAKNIYLKLSYFEECDEVDFRLIKLLNETERYDEALNLCSSNFETAKRVNGELSNDAVYKEERLADCYKEQGKLGMYLALSEDVYVKKCKLYGEEQCLYDLRDLANAFKDIDNEKYEYYSNEYTNKINEKIRNNDSM